MFQCSLLHVSVAMTVIGYFMIVWQERYEFALLVSARPRRRCVILAELGCERCLCSTGVTGYCGTPNTLITHIHVLLETDFMPAMESNILVLLYSTTMCAEFRSACAIFMCQIIGNGVGLPGSPGWKKMAWGWCRWIQGRNNEHGLKIKQIQVIACK